jgi:hypothetical protein
METRPGGGALRRPQRAGVGAQASLPCAKLPCAQRVTLRWLVRPRALRCSPAGAHTTRRPLRLAVVREKVPTMSQQYAATSRTPVQRPPPPASPPPPVCCWKDAPHEHGIMTAAPLHCAHLNCRCGDIASGRPPPRVPMTTLLSCDCVARALTGGSKVLRGLAHACGCRGRHHLILPRACVDPGGTSTAMPRLRTCPPRP